MRTLLTSLAVVVVTGGAVLTLDFDAAAEKAKKKNLAPVGLPSELLPLRIVDEGILVCEYNKECTIKGKLGDGYQKLVSLMGDDGKRRYGFPVSGGWKAKTVTFKVMGNTPKPAFYTVSIVDGKLNPLSNGIRMAVISQDGKCPADGDADDDGKKALWCGGSDCDDNDPNRHAELIEVCDAAGFDEDCDPRTFGIRDGDGDGYPDARCCNGDNCGNDCNDAAEGVHKTATESCNLLDDDCDGVVDEGLQVKVYRDADGDLYGDPAKSKRVCIQTIESGWVLDDRDCKDTDVAVNPRSGCG